MHPIGQLGPVAGREPLPAVRASEGAPTVRGAPLLQERPEEGERGERVGRDVGQGDRAVRLAVGDGRARRTPGPRQDEPADVEAALAHEDSDVTFVARTLQACAFQRRRWLEQLGRARSWLGLEPEPLEDCADLGLRHVVSEEEGPR